VFTGGTGIFAGATGEAILHGTITQTSPTTETISLGNYTGTVNLVTVVPEPGTFALLAPAFAVGAVIVVSQRRRKTMPH
jgi:hypothetical protein